MALISCTECGKQVSDKASICPHCGCPVSEILAEYTRREEERNKTAAFAELTAAARSGYAVAQYLVAMEYLKGENVAADEAAAISWLQKSADQGYEAAEQELSQLLEARLTAAAEDGDPEAQVNLAQLFYERGDYYAAEEWCDKAICGDLTSESPIFSKAMELRRDIEDAKYPDDDEDEPIVRMPTLSELLLDKTDGDEEPGKWKNALNAAKYVNNHFFEHAVRMEMEDAPFLKKLKTIMPQAFHNAKNTIELFSNDMFNFATNILALLPEQGADTYEQVSEYATAIMGGPAAVIEKRRIPARECMRYSGELRRILGEKAAQSPMYFSVVLDICYELHGKGISSAEDIAALDEAGEEVNRFLGNIGHGLLHFCGIEEANSASTVDMLITEVLTISKAIAAAVLRNE